jgi:Tol biopolymer transport system component
MSARNSSGSVARRFLLPLLLTITTIAGCGDDTPNPVVDPPGDTLARVGRRLLYNRGASSPPVVEWIEAEGTRRLALLDAGMEIISEPVAGRFVVRRFAASPTSIPVDSIFVVTIADRSRKLITTLASNEAVNAALTPDGARIVLYRGENQEIYIGSSSGGGLTSIAEFARGTTAPSVSPDGTVVAYVFSDWRGESAHLVNVGGIDDRLLADSVHGGLGGRVSWSPDGSRLVYTGIVGGDRPNLFIVNKDGSGRRRISGDAVSDYNPEWSPDGSVIAFTSEDATGQSEISLINPDGTGRRTLTTSADRSEDFSHWSPDGKKLLYIVTGGPNARSVEVTEIASGATTTVAWPVIGRAFWDYTK